MISNQDFSVYRGTDIVIKVPIVYDNNEIIDLTGYTFKCIMKRNYSDSKDIDNKNVFDMNPKKGVKPNEVELCLTKEQTMAKADKYFYNLDITSSDDKTMSVMEGYIEILENTNA